MATDELCARVQVALGDGYAVERSLGAGGFAVVYLVSDKALKRKLAVKVLSPDVITSHTVLERFRREAETVAQLSHPNIVPLHFIGEKDGLLYLAMACIDGGSVADAIEKGGRLPVEDATRIISEVASALAHAHKRGVVHRDIKPHNVLLDAESGRALVTDFGIARTADSALTATGMFVGTPTYLAPEQVTGEPSDHRADIYALGVMAYEMLTGKPPFEGATPTALLMKRLTETPKSLELVRRDVSPLLASVVAKCLAADPAKRFSSASEIVAALGGEVSLGGSFAGSTVHIVREEKPRPRSMVLAFVFAAIAVIAGAGYVVAGRNGAMAVPHALPGQSTPTPIREGRDGLVAIPAGSYSIGFDGDTMSPPRPSARPRHAVTLGAFHIAQRKVTAGEYKPFADSIGAPMPAIATGDLTRPVRGVLWSEARSYCAWRYPGGRLPSEEEWESAATSTSASRLDGMARDLWEWTSSPARAYPGEPALPDSMGAFRILRGGAANTPIALSKTWFRGYAMPVTRREYLAETGFRCAAP